MKKKGSAWTVAREAVKELPPYLQEGELTAESLRKENPDKLHSVDDARRILDDLVRDGKLEKQPRRTGKGGGHVFVYVALPDGRSSDKERSI